MNIVFFTKFIIPFYLIKKTIQTRDLEGYDDYINVVLTNFESPLRKGDYQDYSNGTTTPQQRPPSEKCSKIGTELVNSVNEYRKELKLSTVALDDDLCFVSKMHLLANIALFKGGLEEATHDWGPPPECPTPPVTWKQMTNKEMMQNDLNMPYYLTGHTGNPNELATFGPKTAEGVINMWKESSSGHNESMTDSSKRSAGGDCEFSTYNVCYLWIGVGEVKQTTNSTTDGSEPENSPEGSCDEGSTQEESGSTTPDPDLVWDQESEAGSW